MNQEGDLSEEELDPVIDALESIFRGPVPEDTQVKAIMSTKVI